MGESKFSIHTASEVQINVRAQGVRKLSPGTTDTMETADSAAYAAAYAAAADSAAYSAADSAAYSAADSAAYVAAAALLFLQQLLTKRNDFSKIATQF